ncbi:hypothetical protein [Alteromonas sp. 14N.309.X.WAT.G.H12]|uniref:hypothetical protein n=1 Tax=Alteromonas sp. 14N.309.X.WAT.G.H12 TaxID=3120824 RepID=UPI002FD188F6
MKRKLVAVLGVLLTGMANADIETDGPMYDCTAEETQVYIEQVTHNLFTPSPIASPEEFQQAYIEQADERAKSGDDDSQTCSAIFTGAELEDGWKDIIDAVREFDLGYDFSGINAAALQALLEEAKEKAQEEFMNALEALGQDICSMVSSEALEEMLLDAINEKYGMNARNLRLSDFADEITDDVMSNADDDILMLLSEEKLEREVTQEGRSKMRELREDLWKKL